MTKKIAFISTMEADPWGGSEELWGLTATRLSEKGLEVGVSVKWWPEEAERILQMRKAGAQVQSRKPKNRIQRLNRKASHLSRFNWLDKFRPDLVVISQGGPLDGVPWAEACLERKLPYVLIVQAAAESWWPGDEDALRAAHFYEGARACFFISQRNLLLIRQQFATPLENAGVVANPFNVAPDVALEWPDQNDGLRLACVGRLEPAAKGQDLILEVLRQEKWKQRSIHVSFAGSGRSSRSLKILSDLYGLEQKVTFKGFVSPIEELWKEHHALLLPSRYEGLPLAVVEAMFCGRPCIVTDVAGNKEVIEDNVSGFIAMAPTADCLDEVLERAWERRSEWQQIGKNASLAVRQHIPLDPIEVFTNKLIQLLGVST